MKLISFKPEPSTNLTLCVLHGQKKLQVQVRAKATC